MAISNEKLVPLLHQQITRLTQAVLDQKNILQFRDQEIEELKELLSETKEALRLEQKYRGEDHEE